MPSQKKGKLCAGRLTRIDPALRRQLLSDFNGRHNRPLPSGGRVALIGDGGVACNERGEILGVCAEAPLPKVLINDRNCWLDGACGIASALQKWGTPAIVCCPQGRGPISTLQKRLLTREKITSIALHTGLSQTIKYTRRVFAGGHQFAHLETEERIVPATAQEISQGIWALKKALGRTYLMCIIDRGCSGIGGEILEKIIAGARKQKISILCDAKSSHLNFNENYNIVKVNQNQINQWFGISVNTDEDALKAAELVRTRSGAKTVIYTRGEQGILVYDKSGSKYSPFLISPEPRKLFDLVSAGDIVTAAFAFCLAKGYSLLHAACFAATAAEISLDQRYEKHFDLKFIYSHKTSLL